MDAKNDTNGSVYNNQVLVNSLACNVLTGSQNIAPMAGFTNGQYEKLMYLINNTQIVGVSNPGYIMVQPFISQTMVHQPAQTNVTDFTYSFLSHSKKRREEKGKRWMKEKKEKRERRAARAAIGKKEREEKKEEE
ncbi:hypothetical protein M9H77_23482 [Catharanthus roseus]|uniref:Uncharacterized protein n=1 Tax=Catharanthus roseus TaxID=4058 RepID=A0ACC0AUE5_CATRO|nr:hypothetical protein M9H77_23482 [Catharanthus roseus]